MTADARDRLTAALARSQTDADRAADILRSDRGGEVGLSADERAAVDQARGSLHEAVDALAAYLASTLTEPPYRVVRRRRWPWSRRR